MPHKTHIAQDTQYSERVHILSVSCLSVYNEGSGAAKQEENSKIGFIKWHCLLWLAVASSSAPPSCSCVSVHCRWKCTKARLSHCGMNLNVNTKTGGCDRSRHQEGVCKCVASMCNLFSPPQRLSNLKVCFKRAKDYR